MTANSGPFSRCSCLLIRRSPTVGETRHGLARHGADGDQGRGGGRELTGEAGVGMLGADGRRQMRDRGIERGRGLAAWPCAARTVRAADRRAPGGSTPGRLGPGGRPPPDRRPACGAPSRSRVRHRRAPRPPDGARAAGPRGGPDSTGGIAATARSRPRWPRRDPSASRLRADRRGPAPADPAPPRAARMPRDRAATCASAAARARRWPWRHARDRPVRDTVPRD